MADQLNYLERGPEAEGNGNGNGNVYLERLRYPTNHVITLNPWQVQELVRIIYYLMQILDQQMHNDNDPLLHHVIILNPWQVQELVRIIYRLLHHVITLNPWQVQELVRIIYRLMQILDQQIHNDNDPLLHHVITLNPWQVQELVRIIYHLMQILDQQMHNDNDPLLHQPMQHIQNNNRLPLGNVVPNGNVQIGHSDPDRAKHGDGITINNLLALYVGAQGAIFNSAFFVEGRTACEIVWTPLILSGLVSLAIIASVFHIFFQQFRQLPQKNYWSWVAQKAAIIMMLTAFSVCLLLSCTSVLCISGR